ncbi:transcriptional regulator [Candidatus Poribacteria bacterium]|nr:MAG: transcriptional regulator [Candidatus Poribacteria bacterium]
MNMESILKCTANFRDYLLKDLAEPGFAKQYLQVSLENYENDGDINILAHAIRNVVIAQGEIEKLAIQTNSNLQDLHDALDAGNPPQLDQLLNILAFYTNEVPTGRGYC